MFSTSLTLAASAERLFDVWLEPALVQRWMCLSNKVPLDLVEVKVDARVGGSFFMVDRSDGHPLEHEGIYLAIEPFNRLQFTYSMPQYGRDIDRITILLHPLPGGCRMEIQHELDLHWADQRERMERAWNMRLRAIRAIAEMEI